LEDEGLKSSFKSLPLGINSIPGSEGKAPGPALIENQRTVRLWQLA